MKSFLWRLYDLALSLFGAITFLLIILTILLSFLNLLSIIHLLVQPATFFATGLVFDTDDLSFTGGIAVIATLVSTACLAAFGLALRSISYTQMTKKLMPWVVALWCVNVLIAVSLVTIDANCATPERWREGNHVYCTWPAPRIDPQKILP